MEKSKLLKSPTKTLKSEDKTGEALKSSSPAPQGFYKN